MKRDFRFCLATLAVYALLFGMITLGEVNGTFTDTSNLAWKSDGTFDLGIEQVPKDTAGENTVERTWDIVDESGQPLFPKELTYSGTISFGGHKPEFNLGWWGWGGLRTYPEALLTRIWVIGCGGREWTVLNANMNTVVDRQNLFVPQQTWSLPPSCGAPLRMKVMIGIAGAAGNTAAELEFYGRWK